MLLLRPLQCSYSLPLALLLLYALAMVAATSFPLRRGRFEAPMTRTEELKLMLLAVMGEVKRSCLLRSEHV